MKGWCLFFHTIGTMQHTTKEVVYAELWYNLERKIEKQEDNVNKFSILISHKYKIAQ